MEVEEVNDELVIRTDKRTFKIWNPNVDNILKGGNNMDCNKKIADYLKDHGISQRFICDKTGLEPEKVSNIMNGKRKITGDELIAICNALGITLDYFKD